MEPVTVDVDAKQIVRWLLADERINTFDLLVSATRSYERVELTPGEEGRLGDEESEELSEINETGLLEVMPRKEPGRWALRIRVTDDIGPRMPDDEPVPSEDEEIDLAAFHAEFIQAERGFTEVGAEVQNHAASADLTRLIEAIVTDRHKS
ncbi:MAG: hypothetical protein ACM3MH_05415 [Actinomycetota bacterium]